MNGLQRYFLNEAIKAINLAAGNLVKDGELDAITVVSSKEELLNYMKEADSKISSQINFPYVLFKYEKIKNSNENISLKPLFAKPINKSTTQDS